jgi:hypothetical protein
MRAVQPGEGHVTVGARATPTRPTGLPARGRRRVRALVGWLVEHRLELAVGLAASLPIIVSTIEVIEAGWVPVGDDGLIAVSAYDVLSADSPLLGPWSSGYSAIVGEPAFHPGPLLFWLLALPARFLPPGAMEVTVALVNVASVVGAVGLARRRGGPPLMFAVALAIPIMLASLPAEAYSDIWNPSVPLLPFTLLIFLCWSLACGEYRLLPLTVLVASLVAQCHLGFLVPTLGLVAVGLVGLATPPGPKRRKRELRPWLAAAILVALVCWSGPLADQATNRPGNGVLIVRAATADEPTLGLDQGWRAVVHAIGVVPWWLRDPQVPFERLVDLAVAPGAMATGSTILILGGLAATTLWAGRRRRGDLVAAGALGLVLCVALALVTASTPERFVDTLGYSLRWASPLGMWVWLALVWSLAMLIRRPRRLTNVSRPAHYGLRERSLATAVALGLVAAVGGIVAASGELVREPYDEMRTIGERLDTELAPGGPIRVEVMSDPDAALFALGFGSGITYSLRDSGRQVTAPQYAEYLGPEYGPRAGQDELVVRVDVDSTPPRQGRVLIRLAVPEHGQPGDPLAPKRSPVRAVTVSLLPAAAEGPPPPAPSAEPGGG